MLKTRKHTSIGQKVHVYATLTIFADQRLEYEIWFILVLVKHTLSPDMFDTMHMDEVRTFYTFDKKISIYIDCRKLNAEFNKVIKAVGYRVRFFEKWGWTHPPCQQFWLYLEIFIFSLIKSLSCHKTLKVLGLYVLCSNRMSL